VGYTVFGDMSWGFIAQQLIIGRVKFKDYGQIV